MVIFFLNLVFEIKKLIDSTKSNQIFSRENVYLSYVSNNILPLILNISNVSRSTEEQNENKRS